MGARSLTGASGSPDDESPLSEEAAVRPWDQVVRALGRDRAAGVGALAQVGRFTAGLPTVVVPSVLEKQGGAGIAGLVVRVVHPSDATVHIALGGERDREGLRFHRRR